jgi:hypothetical protein
MGLGGIKVASLAMAIDHFGASEVRATLQAVYETLLNGILDELKSQGFDIAAYRDRDGRLNIQAEKIEQIVVGERVFMQKEEAHENGGKQASAASSGNPASQPSQR